MSELVAYLLVLVAAGTPWLEVLLVVPAGVLGGLPVVPTVVVATVGNVATLVPVVLAGDRLRERFVRRARHRGREPSGRGGRARRLLERYGVPGLAALGPLLTGAHLAAAVAMAAGANRRRALVWFASGVAVWAGIAGLLTVLGVDVLFDRTAAPDLDLP
jgi:membrane protein DedA with SNARE-associated domain